MVLWFLLLSILSTPSISEKCVRVDVLLPLADKFVSKDEGPFRKMGSLYLRSSTMYYAISSVFRTYRDRASNALSILG